MSTTDSVTEPITDEAATAAQEANEESIELMARVEAFTIATAEEYQSSGELLRDIKTRQKAVTDTRTGITKPMDAAKKHVMDLFKPVAERLTAAETTIKAAMITFTRAEEARQREEQARLDEVARRERQSQEARAADAREKGEHAKATVLEQAPAITPKAEAPTKAAGVHTVTTWSAEVVDLGALIGAAATDPALHSCLTPDMSKLNTLARALKEGLKIPGVRAVSETGVAARAR